MTDLNHIDTYRRRKWDKTLAFRWNDTHGYYAYIDRQSGEFKKAYHSYNEGKPSRVGSHILEYNDIIKENNMDVNYIGGEYKVVKVGEYYCKIDIAIEVYEHDYVIIELQPNRYNIAQVDEVLLNNIDNANLISKAQSWVVDIVDMTAQEGRKTNTVQREYILKQLEEKRKAMEIISMYEALAKTDSKVAKLLNELKEIDNENIDIPKG